MIVEEVFMSEHRDLKPCRVELASIACFDSKDLSTVTKLP
jgi:hypothetical protein